MTIGCNAIVDCVLANCKNLVPGIKDIAYFINFDCVDKDLSTFDPTNAMLCTQLVLKATSPECHAFCVEGYNYSNEHKASLVKKTYQKSWEHGFIFRVFDNTPEVKLWIQNLKGSRFMIIQENNYNKPAVAPYAAGRTVFEILGYDFGLELNAAERDVNSEDTLGGWLLTAGCHDKMKESMPPLAYFVGGTLALTKSALHSMLAHCCTEGTLH
jgi:hypothetical protein